MSTLIRRVNPANGIAPFARLRCADVGDAPVNPFDLPATLDAIEAFFAAIHGAGAAPLTAGGDHLITLPILRAIARTGPLGLVHIDAHSDTSDAYFAEAPGGAKRLTHGTPFRRAIEEGLLDPHRVIQVGIRGSLNSLDELDWPRAQGVGIVTMEDARARGIDAVIAEARRRIGQGPAYVSFDVDGLDPAFAPGTGTPEVGGLTPFEAQRLLRGLEGLAIVGGDVVEVAPPFDPTGNTALVAATMMFEILCLMAAANGCSRVREQV